MATHSSILAWKIPWTRNLVGNSSWGHKESSMNESLSTNTQTKEAKKKNNEFEKQVFVFQ